MDEDSRGMFTFDGNSNASLSNLLLPDKITSIQDFLDAGIGDGIDLNSVFDLTPSSDRNQRSSLVFDTENEGYEQLKLLFIFQLRYSCRTFSAGIFIKQFLSMKYACK